MTDGTETEVWIEDFLIDLIELAGFDIVIEEISLDEDEVLYVQLGGPDSARVIGREGQVLDAIQTIVIAAAIHSGVAHRRILVDVEHYRARREQRLFEEATRMAEEAIDSGRSLEFPPMSARERRLVHLAVAEMDGVKTESSGDGEDRYVRVIPV